MLVVWNLYVRELSEVVESSPSLTDLLDLKRVSEDLLRLERLGESRLANLARNLEKIERIEEIVKKMLAVRYRIIAKLEDKLKAELKNPILKV